MRLKLLPLILLGIYFANSSQFHPNLPLKACQIVREILINEFNTKTIAIVKMERKFDGNVIDELMKCLPREVTVVVIDILSYNLDSENIKHNPTLNVLLVDVFANENMVREGIEARDGRDKTLLNLSEFFLNLIKINVVNVT
jgi:hypothetical protein